MRNVRLRLRAIALALGVLAAAAGALAVVLASDETAPPRARPANPSTPRPATPAAGPACSTSATDAPASAAEAALRAWGVPVVYRTAFAVLDTGGGRSTSAQYGVTDRLTKFVPAVARQTSANYRVVDLLAVPRVFANNGLASGQGTTMKLTWSESGKPSDALGYDVYRSGTGNPGTYRKINGGRLSAPRYDDRDLANGVYWYIVYLVRGTQQLEQWTPPFWGTIKVTKAKDWALY